MAIIDRLSGTLSSGIEIKLTQQAHLQLLRREHLTRRQLLWQRFTLWESRQRITRVSKNHTPCTMSIHQLIQEHLTILQSRLKFRIRIFLKYLT